MKRDLIYDFGVHIGQDTDFYLRKGFRVIAIEALPELCQSLANRQSEAVRKGQLIIVNAAIVATPGPVTFFVSENSIWGTVNPAWAERNERLGAKVSKEIIVPGVTAGELLAEHGVPYYMKIDIEGSDVLCLEALHGQADRPKYVSIESDKVSWACLVSEFDLFQALGYTRFKVIGQHEVSKQELPKPAREGEYAEHTFVSGASGAFGEEAPGPWLTRRQALSRYSRIFRQYKLYGDGVAGRRSPLALAGRTYRRLRRDPGWYDTHASR